MKENSNINPVLIGKRELDLLPYLLIAPIDNKCKAVRFYKVGEVTQAQIDLLAITLANNHNFEYYQFFDNAGGKWKAENGEFLTDTFKIFVDRIKKGEISELTLQYMESKQSPERKTSPYFEERTVNGVEGIYYIKPKIDKETGEILSEQELWTSNPLSLKGEGFNDSGEAFYIFEWEHPRTKKPHTEAIPLQDFGSAAGWEIMKKYGLKMTNRSYLTELADHFHHYGDHHTKWSITEVTGWKNDAYILPNGEVLGEPKSRVLFKNKHDGVNAYAQKGDLDSWREDIADNLKGNPYLMLAVACSLASPTLSILNAKSFGIHLYNDSSKGKTTALNIANSIWGNPEDLDHKWNQTPVAMMNNAQSRNDNFLTLDEIGQCKNFDDLEQTAYLLFNETGRIRGKKDGGNQQIAKWKITALSTGEIDLEGFLQSKGRNIQAGSLVRLLNIPMSEPKNLHHFTNAKEHADHLNEAVKNNFGTVGRAWINYLIANKSTVKEQFKQYKKLWIERIPAAADSQVLRVVDNFAILETALQLSKHLTGWTETEAREAIITCFNSWLAIFGNRSREETNIIERVNNWLVTQQHISFIEVNPQFEVVKMPPSGRAPSGYKIPESKEYGIPHFLIYPGVFNEIISGKAKTVALKALSDAGILDQDLKESKRPFQRKISRKLEQHQPYCYVVYHLKED